MSGFGNSIFTLGVPDCEELVGVTWRVSDCEELVGVAHSNFRVGIT